MSASKKRSAPDVATPPPRKRKPAVKGSAAKQPAPVDVYDFNDDDDNEQVEDLNFSSFKSSPMCLFSSKKVCGKCCELAENSTDMKSCTGLCRRSFHLTCYPREEGEVTAEWKCPECKTGEHPCFVCNKYTPDVRKCSDQSCFRHYHRACLTKSYPHKVVREGSDDIVCPLHFCLTCHIDNQTDHLHRNVKRKLVQCLKCPTAYHILDDCIAAGTVVIATDKFVVCPEHHIRKKRDKQINVSFCFSCCEGGQLICCERCPAAFHQKCLEMDELPEGHFYCGDCRARKQLLYGDIIWAKLGSYRWWPGKIVDPKDCPKNVMQLRGWDVGQFPVYFFGSHDYNWIDQGRVFRYDEGDSKKGFVASGSKRMDKNFLKGLEEAKEALKEFNEARSNSIKNKQTRPAPYVKIRVNKPYGKVQIPTSESRHSNACECDPNKPNPCSSESDCLNRLMMLECNENICKAGDKCCNQRFKRRQEPELEHFNTGTRGWGLRTKQDIKKGSFVVEYVGELIDEEECQRRLKEKAQNEDSNFYFLTLDKDVIIDAGPKGNMARFMNHSCQPNCETQKWEVNGQTKVGLFAIQDIAAGTELTFNYNLDCRGNEKTVCDCGAKNCSKYIGVRPTKEQRESNGLNGSARKKKEKEKKVSRAKSFANEHDDDCFFCGIGGELIMCDKRSCPRSYHLKCCQLTAIPRGKWDCPHHHCDECGRPSVQLCSYCPCSYCPQHKMTTFKEEEDGRLQCPHHEEPTDEVDSADVDENESASKVEQEEEKETIDEKESEEKVAKATASNEATPTKRRPGRPPGSGRKRGRGRSPRGAGQTPARTPARTPAQTPTDTPSPIKRGRGRPPRARPPVEPEKAEASQEEVLPKVNGTSKSGPVEEKTESSEVPNPTEEKPTAEVNGTEESTVINGQDVTSEEPAEEMSEEEKPATAEVNGTAETVVNGHNSPKHETSDFKEQENGALNHEDIKEENGIDEPAAKVITADITENQVVPAEKAEISAVSVNAESAADELN